MIAAAPVDYMYNLGLTTTVYEDESCAGLFPSRTVAVKQVLLETISFESKFDTSVQRKKNSLTWSDLLAVPFRGSNRL